MAAPVTLPDEAPSSVAIQYTTFTFRVLMDQVSHHLSIASCLMEQGVAIVLFGSYNLVQESAENEWRPVNGE